ncbi:phosphoribosylglycinamide formyltransferase [Aminobacter sp. UC22_36]|uniref:phosphoribosylglycinamide formyltransferase n=1 Tax=Aminobacter sp. UC22_36 TaxID=3374549 RepID=UPI0037577B49
MWKRKRAPEPSFAESISAILRRDHRHPNLCSKPPKRIAWAVSGQGRGCIAVQAAIDRGLIDAEIGLIVTDRPSSIADFARARDIPCVLIEPDVVPFHPNLLDVLATHRCEWMGLTFNRLLSEAVLDAFGGRIFNVHFSLLPMYPGFGARTKTLTAGMRMTAATIHLIDANPDNGIILAQAACAVTASDTPPTLGLRMFEAVLPQLLQVVRSIASDELTFERGAGLTWPRAHIAPSAPTYVFPLIDADLEQFAANFCRNLQL